MSDPYDHSDYQWLEDAVVNVCQLFLDIIVSCVTMAAAAIGSILAILFNTDESDS